MTIKTSQPALTFAHTSAPRLLADVNALFDAEGQERPVREDDTLGQAVVALSDGVPVGAAYSTMTSYIADTFMLAGEGTRGAYVALRFRSLKGVAVIGEHSGEDVAAHLVRSVASHARRDFGAHYLLAGIPIRDRRARTFMSARGFEVALDGHHMHIDGVAMPTADGFRDLWWRLVRKPASTVHSLSLSR
jgi:GNAT superfamily N-acetyltransferase